MKDALQKAIHLTEEEEAKTNLLTPASREARRRFKVPLILISSVKRGSFIERGTEGKAA